MCANRVMFKQLLQANAIDFCQIDSARIGGVNEILSVYFMAKKFNGNQQQYEMKFKSIIYLNYVFFFLLNQ